MHATETKAFQETLSKNELKKRGLALYNLLEKSRKVSVGGRLFVEFGCIFSSALPAHTIRVGDVVIIRCGSSDLVNFLS